ncbi:maltose ABC transporter membrane protein /trehalose ABC transporter membrane protein /sucrose ABC transporter membrane protein [Palleronia marisminoris]|uniref:Trehalose transport system permease protein SugB n=1 Tax=Palleronia marisminoris TaxID=315423 RepID=A0A1Y5TF55_9RHOB|nr:carbohydrate ABC transporter permease [Palleronia marisminoris]SFH37537.1 maltose ABC transporter membrane protein /trehalose ABC transporter membrane protein /sucrose ABC transporter membrane protein [Palleronia marisminoris]SLN62663.1 Trehalose transport system permease protein SugB [Palleronia marisminoris]
MDNIAGQKSSLAWATHLSVLLLVLLWLIPTIGLFVSSFRDRDQISESGWWEAPFPVELTARGRTAAEATQEGDVFVVTGSIYDDPEAKSFFPDGGGEVVAFGTRGVNPTEFEAGTTVELGEGETLTVNADGTYEWRTPEDPGDRGQRIYFAAESPPSFTTENYEQVLTADNMDRAFINTLTVTIPATIIPILVAAFAAYALAWMEFPGRGILIAAVVGLLVVPLQLALVPMLNLHNRIGIGQSFMGIWFAHTAFGMPLAVYLLRNYMAGLPRDIIECARVDGATDFQLFLKIVLPLSLPALAAFSIFQFLWTWNDLLVAKVFLPSDDASKVMTVKIADDLLGSRGGDWGILATAAFVSIAVPLIVFFSMQRFLVRGLLAGSVK